MKEAVNHPAHYGGEENPFEPIKIIEHYGLDFHLGNVVKYVLRAGKKEDELADLKKAAWYLQRKIGLLEAEIEPKIDWRSQQVVKDVETGEKYINDFPSDGDKVRVRLFSSPKSNFFLIEKKKLRYHSEYTEEMQMDALFGKREEIDWGKVQLVRSIHNDACIVETTGHHDGKCFSGIDLGTGKFSSDWFKDCFEYNSEIQ